MLALEIVGQRCAAVRGKVVNRPRQITPFAGVEVIQTAYKGHAIVGAIVPYNLIRCGPPLKPRALLPVPSCCLSDFGPFVPVFEIDKTNLGTIRRFNLTVIKIDFHPQQIASRGIKLKTLIKEKPCINPVSAGSGIRDSDYGRIPRIARLHYLAEVGVCRVARLGIRSG